MRKFLIVMALLMLAIVPSMADGHENTIAEIVVASTEGEEPEFTVLLAAVQAADPVFLEVLSSDSAAGWTVFAPTDAAFADLLAALEVSAEDLLANTDLLNEVLSYHMVPGTYTAETVVGLDDGYLGTLLHHDVLSVDVTDDGVFVNESQVVATDVEATNGIVHVIDAVLVPEADEMMDDMDDDMMMEDNGTIVDIVVASTEGDEPQFTVLLAAVQAADPSVAEILSGPGPWTVLAPTDEAFGEALDALGLTAEELLADTETLTGILAYHVAPGYLAAEDIIGLSEMMDDMDDDMGVWIGTLAGSAVEFTGEGFNGGGLVATDIVADNGIIHVIDTVLLPPADDM